MDLHLTTLSFRRPILIEALFNMKTILAFLAVAAVTVAAPQGRENPSNNIGVDGYSYSYELSDGTTRDESAQVEILGKEQAVIRVQGSYSWVNPFDGQVYTVTYIADENGFQPQGAHLPKIPVIATFVQNNTLPRKQ